MIFVKIITIVATIVHILRIKCNKFYFGLLSAPYGTPLEELTTLSQTPYLDLKGLLLRVREGGERMDREGKGRIGGGNVQFHHLLLSNLTTKCFSNICNFDIMLVRRLYLADPGLNSECITPFYI